MSERDGRPERMYQAGRLPVQEFDDNESLYRRFPEGEGDAGGLYPNAIAFYPRMSMNRGLFSEPEDVLIPSYNHCGIAKLRVGDLPEREVSSGGVLFQWAMMHCPELDNYAHSEWRTYKGGEHSERMDVPKTIKLKVRTILADRAVIVRPPARPISP